MRYRIAPLLCAVILLSPAAAAAELPTGHPRLFVDGEDVPALRKKVRKAPYSHMLKRIEEMAKEEFDPSSTSSSLYDMRVRHMATAYLLTGKKQYAADAEKRVLELVADKEFWNDPGSKGLTRAAGALSVAMAYDLCYDAWSGSTREKVSAELLEIARGMMKSMGRGANTRIANNWQGVRYGASGLAALACDEEGREKVARDAYSSMVRHIKANIGANGWNPEGIGYTIYPATFTGPYGIAAQRAGIGDLRKDVPAYMNTYWTTLAGTAAIPTNDGRLGMRADLSDDHPHYNSNGTCSLAFWYAPPKQVPAVKWMYDYLLGERGSKSWDVDRWGGGLYSVLLYPTEVEARNPAEVVGLNYVDKSHGAVIFRNRFRDANDTVALVNACGRRPSGCHAGPDTNTFRILGLGAVFVTGSGRTGDTAGQTNLFASEPPSRANGEEGTLASIRFDEDGGGLSVTRGSCMGVKNHVKRFRAIYDDRSGVEAVFVNADTSRNGTLWRLNTPGFNKVETRGNSFIITAPNGAVLTCTVVEPAKVTFRTGTFRRGGGPSRHKMLYHGKRYPDNKWIEFDCDARVCVVMTLAKTPAPVKVDRSLHGAEISVGKLKLAYEKQSGKVYTGEEAAKLDLSGRNEPLRPRGLRARTLSDSAIELGWISEPLGSGKLEVQRATDANAPFEKVAAVKTSDARYVDRKLPSDANFVYRLAAINEHGRSDPSEAVPAATWEEGTELYVEDFAPRSGGKLPEDNVLGRWKIVNGNRGWSMADETGSPRGAQAEKGTMRTGSVKIGNSNLFYTEDVRCDLSGRDAKIEFDYRDRAVTRMAAIVKLADGRWVMSGLPYLNSRHQWKTASFAPRKTGKWFLVDIRRPGHGKEVEVTAADLKDVRGIGVYATWVINQKWARVDQLHLYARDVKLLGRKK